MCVAALWKDLSAPLSASWRAVRVQQGCFQRCPESTRSHRKGKLPKLEGAVFFGLAAGRLTKVFRGRGAESGLQDVQGSQRGNACMPLTGSGLCACVGVPVHAQLQFYGGPCVQPTTGRQLPLALLPAFSCLQRHGLPTRLLCSSGRRLGTFRESGLYVCVRVPVPAQLHCCGGSWARPAAGRPLPLAPLQAFRHI